MSDVSKCLLFYPRTSSLNSTIIRFRNRWNKLIYLSAGLNLNSIKASLAEANRKKSSKNVSSQKAKSSNRNTNLDDC